MHDHFPWNRAWLMLNGWLFSCVLVVLTLVTSGCDMTMMDRAAVDPNNLKGPQYAYPLDELALLNLASQEILELEKRQDYETVYTKYASAAFKRKKTLHHFLLEADCLEGEIGSVIAYDNANQGFRRLSVKSKGKELAFDTIVHAVNRPKAIVQEQQLFRVQGPSVKLVKLTWDSAHPPYQACLKGIQTNTGKAQ